MSDETYKQIYEKGAPPLRMPAAPRRDNPFQGAPKCETHCSGRHEIDGVMQCKICGTAMYQILLHEWRDQEAHYWNELIPLNGAPAYNPFAPPPRCCGEPLIRR